MRYDFLSQGLIFYVQKAIQKKQGDMALSPHRPRAIIIVCV